MGQLQATATRPWDVVVLLETTAAWIMVLLEDKRREHVAARAEGWKKWVREQMANGGGAAHKFVKR